MPEFNSGGMDGENKRANGGGAHRTMVGEARAMMREKGTEEAG